MFSVKQHIALQFIFFKVIFSGILPFDKRSRIARKKIKECHSFRVVGLNPERDYLASIRYLKRATYFILRQKRDRMELKGTSVYVHKERQRTPAVEYIEFVTNSNVSNVLCRDTIDIRMHWAWRLLMIAQLYLMFPFFLFGTFFSKRKSSLSLLMLQWAENNLISQVYVNSEVHEVYLFGGYENDQCLTGIYFEQIGVPLVLVPSPNPIKNFYRQVIAHTFIFTAHFQRVEFNVLKSDWIIKDSLDWPIPEVSKLLPYAKRSEVRSNRIAFMSRGVWLRKLRGVHAQDNNKDFDYEEGCMEVLREFLLQNPIYELLILPHPMERGNEDFWQKTQDYYNRYFEGIQVVYPKDAAIPSYQMFAEAQLALASISSVNIERLFCGYKTLYAPIGAEHDFFSGSSLDNIVARTPQKLMDLLSQSVRMTEEEFFQTFDLKAYRHNQD
jgi:hypothetical protein